MQPDFILIGIIVFFICGMLKSNREVLLDCVMEGKVRKSCEDAGYNIDRLERVGLNDYKVFLSPQIQTVDIGFEIKV